jgi:hypothetical protein
VWQVATEKQAGVILQRYLAEGTPLSWRQVLALWISDPEFCDFFSATLAAVPYRAFCWETAGLSTADMDTVAEVALIDNPSLDVPAEQRDFQDYFRTAEQVVVFANLGGDASLVVPCPRYRSANYSHLVAFLRTAPAIQQRALWAAVGAAVVERVSPVPLWLNTAGGGVDWLHVRLDSRPKYYRYPPFTVG